MKVFDQTERDFERNVLRVEFTGEDLDLLEGVMYRLEVLAKIEDAMDSVAVRGPFILSRDIPWETRDGIKLLRELVALDEPVTEAA